MLCILGGCGSGKNKLLENASPSTSAMFLYRYDGEDIVQGGIYEQSVEEEILASLAGVKVKAVGDWSPDRLTYHIYGMWIGGEDGTPIKVAWSNGYFITEAGEIYSFDYDFEKLFTSYDWNAGEGNNRFTSFPCARVMSIKDGQWVKEMMVEAPEPEFPQNITLEIVEQTEAVITAELKNQSDGDWTHGSSYWMEVCLDGVWYSMPTAQGEWAFTMEAHIFPPGESETKKFYTNMYGNLPTGTYRINFQGVLAEFIVE